MDLAAFAALRCPLDVEVGGLLYQVDPPSLQQWAAALDEPIPLLALLGHGQAVRLNMRLRDGDVDLAELTAAWQDLLEVSADFPWWVTVRLLLLIVQGWEGFAGQLGKRGVDPLGLPLDLATATVWAMLREGAGDDLAVEKLRMQLWQPPEEQGRPAPRWSAEDEGSAWKAAAAGASNLPGVRTAAG